MTEEQKFSYCESVAAGSASRWHIRKLTEKGRKLGGGVDTPSLCGHVKPHYGWDLEVAITVQNLASACPRCAGILVDALVKKSDGGSDG